MWGWLSWETFYANTVKWPICQTTAHTDHRYRAASCRKYEVSLYFFAMESHVTNSPRAAQCRSLETHTWV